MTISRRLFLQGGAALPLALAAGPAIARAAPGRTGFAQVPGGRIWWRMDGSGPKTPLLLLHGGPGTGHDYLEPLAALATQRPVIFYDQLGCGRSDRPDDPSLWTPARFVKEIDALRAALGLDRILLYGHSWGGWLAQDYMRQSPGAASVDALVLASTSASAAQFTAGAARLLAALPDGMDATRHRLEAAGQTDTPAYQAIVQAFYDRHLVHLDPLPAYAQRAFANLASSRTYPAMNGPNEFTVTGTLRGWDAEAALGRIKVPTLVLSGELDEFTPDCHETLHRGIAGSRLVVLSQARHLAMVERPAAYVAVLRDFLAPFA